MNLNRETPNIINIVVKKYDAWTLKFKTKKIKNGCYHVSCVFRSFLPSSLTAPILSNPPPNIHHNKDSNFFFSL